MINSTIMLNKGDLASINQMSKSDEEAIIRQFHRIQKGYSRLMDDVAKELDLVKNWIGSQAMIKRNDIKSKITSRLNRN